MSIVCHSYLLLEPGHPVKNVESLDKKRTLPRVAEEDFTSEREADRGRKSAKIMYRNKNKIAVKKNTCVIDSSNYNDKHGEWKKIKTAAE